MELLTTLFDESVAWRRQWEGQPFPSVDQQPPRRSKTGSKKLDLIEEKLTAAWAAYYGLKQARRSPHWRALFGDYPRYAGNWNSMLPPYSDHTTLWRRAGAKAAEVLATQPYRFLLGKSEDEAIDVMKGFADEKKLRFWVSRRPAWHFPGGVSFVEWARPDSKFAEQRNTATADELQETLYCYG